MRCEHNRSASLTQARTVQLTMTRPSQRPMLTTARNAPISQRPFLRTSYRVRNRLATLTNAVQGRLGFVVDATRATAELPAR